MKQHLNESKATNYSQRQKLKIQQKNLDDNIEKNFKNHKKLTTDVSNAKKQEEEIKNDLELLWKQLEDLNRHLEKQCDFDGWFFFKLILSVMNFKLFFLKKFIIKKTKSVLKIIKRVTKILERTMGNKELEREVEEVKEVKQLLKDVTDHRNKITSKIKNLENQFEKLGGRKHHFKLPSENFLRNQENHLDKKSERINK